MGREQTYVRQTGRSLTTRNARYGFAWASNCGSSSAALPARLNALSPWTDVRCRLICTTTAPLSLAIP